MRNAARGHELVALRRLNTTVALRAPHRRSPQTLAGRAVGTGLSGLTVEAAVDEPTERGLVGESTEAQAAGERPPGRPARRFRFRAGAGHVLGVDIGLHKRGLLLGAHVPRRGAVPARCVGVPGVVDAGGAVTSVVVAEWSGVDLGRLLSDDTKGHDVHLAVLDEHRQGAATLAGERGRLPLLGINTARTALRGPGARRAGESEVTAPARAADAADPDALAAVTACADRLAPGVAARPLAVGPEPTVLTGEATPTGRHLVPLLEERLRPVTPHAPHVPNAPRLALSRLGERGVALGTVRKALEHVGEELLADTAP
ncbi:ROK family transcriptional regulator [Streptomyces huasconensis]|uniref:ROK family transcriptional regulator n=1 Tax=Streptomyces huasconensis TaxID=1854574 RepID=A0ABV3LY34_9ACTN